MAYTKVDPVIFLKRLLEARGHGAEWYSGDEHEVNVIKGIINGRLEFCGTYAELLGKIFPHTERFWFALGGFSKEGLVKGMHFICGLFDLGALTDSVIYKMCKTRKPFSEFGHNPLSLVWLPGKVALYIGNGVVAYEGNEGIVIEDINVMQWTGCALLNDVNVIDEGVTETGESLVIPKSELFVGSEGKRVKIVQEALFTIGYIKKEDAQIYKDGVFGKKTAQAILKFQRDNGINETGQLDRETALALTHRMSNKG